MNPLHVAVVTETYPPEVNGVAATVWRVVEGLVAAGHRVQLVRPRQGEADVPAAGPGLTEWLAPGAPIPRYPGLRMGLPCGRALRACWRQARPDVVHLVTEGPLGLSALRAARALGLPVVSDFRTNFHAYSAHYRLGWLRRPLLAYLRAFHNRTAATLVPTEALRRELAAAGFERLRVVARGVDAQRFAPTHRSAALRAQWGADARTMVALYVGRLAPEKNLATVFAAWDAMREDEPRLRLVLVGDGPERERLQRERPDAVFCGLQRGAALASGLALLSYSHAAAAELVRHGENGLLAPAGDRETFCALARRLAGDWPQVRALGHQARQTALGLDWGRIVQGVEQAYADAPGVARSAAAERQHHGHEVVGL